MSKKRKKRPRRQLPPQAAAQASTAVPPAKPQSRRRATGAHTRRAGRRDERPPAPWGSFPLVELAVLIGIVMVILGFVVGGDRGPLLLVTGLVLASIAGFELAIREHFSGYRSHSTLLAGLPAAVVLGLLFYLGPAGLPPLARLAIALAVFGAAFSTLVALFRRRAGVSFKLR